VNAPRPATEARTTVTSSRFARAVSVNPGASEPVDELQAAWIEYVGDRPWTVFAYLTFRDAISLPAAERLFRLWINKLSQQILGSGQYSRGHRLRWVKTTEFHDSGNPHYHVLIHSPQGFPFREAEAEWRRIAGIGRVQQFVSGMGGIAYVMKHVRVDGEGIVDLGGDWVVQSPVDVVVRAREAGTR